MKTIGLIGGWGWQASAGYYRIINQEVRARLGGWHSARMIIDSQDLHPLSTAKSGEEFEAIRRTLVQSAKRLEHAGADVLVIACNTVHRFADSVNEEVGIPLLHIADVAGEALGKDGHTKIGILGTLATMQAPFYRWRLADRHGLEVILPSESLRAEVDGLITSELTSGNAPSACAPRLDPAIEYLADQGCTSVLLACTDLGLAYGDTDAPIIKRALPLYDSGVLHARAAVQFALA